jgi:hypothetical protein
MHATRPRDRERGIDARAGEFGEGVAKIPFSKPKSSPDSVALGMVSR